MSDPEEWCVGFFSRLLYRRLLVGHVVSFSLYILLALLASAGGGVVFYLLKVGFLLLVLFPLLLVVIISFLIEVCSKGVSDRAIWLLGLVLGSVIGVGSSLLFQEGIWLAGAGKFFVQHLES